MQLSRKTRSKDLEKFFSAVGRVHKVELVKDSISGRNKGTGIAYVEFKNIESVPLALGLKLN